MNYTAVKLIGAYAAASAAAIAAVYLLTSELAADPALALNSSFFS
jgi:hypothetical protein